ncbi:orexin receptor type 2-like [Mizuhopecten yessoensis]|uniref:Cholecystokinin receptor n=1 Tax=Mizuhopecten yessoensis TaxID=6573 RepID=A0A210QZT8_MIZYE|nr:orexin receptor type 2-like [Mizuhopecten yessoensis]OWF54283.1 Cholecystokinin receptor [Mizuhopecten yessoensis]
MAELHYSNGSLADSMEYNFTRIADVICSYEYPYEPVSTTSIAIICMLAVFSVVGSIGNILVIYVYAQRKDHLTSSVFILALAGTDFITCLIVIPYTIVSIYENYVLRFDAVCKFYNFLITSNVPLSAFIMVAIAVDRYICICHPFVHILTVPRAKTTVSLLGAFACVLGLITALNYDVYQTFPEIALNVSNGSTLEQCELIYTGVCVPTNKIIPQSFREAYQKVYASFFLISVLLVIGLYSVIYRSVISRRAKRQKQKRTKQFSTTMVQTDETTQITSINHTATSTSGAVDTNVEIKENGSCSKVVTQKLNNGETVPLKSAPPKNTLKEKKDHVLLANIKMAIMLCIVTVVFIIAFLPAWLMALEWITYHEFGFYIYFIYNVANPVIYAFMNPTFRNDLLKLQSCGNGR